MYSFTEEEIVGLLGHHVTITVKSQKSNTVKGYLYTIDPDTNNIVLFDTIRVFIVMNHHVEHLESNYEKKKLFITKKETYFLLKITVDKENQLDLSLIDKTLKYESENKFSQEWIDKQRLKVFQLLEKVKREIF